MIVYRLFVVCVGMTMRNNMLIVYSMEIWIVSILVGVLFFVSGQFFLRESFDIDNNYFTTAITFSLAIGAISLLLLGISHIYMPELLVYNNSKLINAAIAGLFFSLVIYFGYILFQQKNR